MLKILFIHRNLPPDTFTGVAVQVHRLANALTAKGHDVFVLTTTLNPIDGKYTALPFKPWFMKYGMLKVFFNPLKRILIPLSYRFIPFKKYDIVHVHGDGGFLKYKKNFLRTFYGTAHSELKSSQSIKGKIAQALSFYLERREDKQISGLSKSVGISPHIKNHLPSISDTVPCMLASYGKNKKQKTSVPTILFMGTANSRKRGEWALELFIQLKKIIGELEMYYVGSQANKDAKLFDSMNKNSYRGIHFYQRISEFELSNLYQISWTYLSLSSYEGFGVSLIEAMSHKCLTLTTKTPGSEFIIDQGENGVMINEKNAFKKLKDIFQNFDEYSHIISNGFEYSKKYSPETISNTYESIYKEIINQ